MMDRYEYLEKMYRHVSARETSHDPLTDYHLPRQSDARWTGFGKKKRAPRVHISRTQIGSSNELLLLTLGLVSGLGALALAAYQFGF